jgi:predicted nucleic acid-binding protein
MAHVLVDTNVLVSFLTDRNPRQQKVAAGLFAEAQSGSHRLVLHQAVITELVYVLGNLYQVPPARVRDTLESLVSFPAVEILDDVPWPKLFGIWPETMADFADAILASVATTGASDTVATFDSDFRKRLGRLGVECLW